MLKAPAVLWSKKPCLAIFMMLIVACSTPSEVETPGSPTKVVQDTVTSVPAESTALPPQEPIPEGLIRIPVPASAEQTAAELNSAEHPPFDRYRLAKELRGLTQAEIVPDVPLNPDYQVNDRIEFMINKNLSGIANFRPLPARLRHISDNAYWWVAAKVEADDAKIVAAAQNFEEEVLKINHMIFGEEWKPGIDNDPRMHILIVFEPSWGSKYGYFSDINEYPSILEPNSNQKEMLIVNLRAVRIDSTAFAGELSHEIQHLINWKNDPNEDVWWTETMSELAKFLAGAEPKRVQGLSNALVFARTPHTQLTARPDQRLGDEDLTVFAHYGAERLFGVYLLEQYGPQFIKDIAGNPAPGVMGIREELAKLPDEPSFEEIYANWIIANLINKPSLAEGQFGYLDIKREPPLLEPVQSFDGEPIADRLPPYGTRYYQVRRDSPVQVEFSGSTLARLTPADPTSGEFVWYSNRGDATEFTLTRSFDLNSIDSATLNYNAWYQLEDFYDYAYLEVSTDGGDTWEILETAHGTDNDPNLASQGFGYTGSSVEWLSESIDLSLYAGQEIMLRFHVITGLSTNREGLQVDDIAIPELGYFDGAEDDNGGWQAKGFVRSSNLVPVEWILWLVKTTNPLEVERITLNPDQSAEFTIEDLGEEFPLAAVAISPTAPVSTANLDYEITFRQP
jgi:hypothetical protein